MQIITTLCDLCYDNDESKVESLGTYRVEINGRATEIDLCAKHDAVLEEVLTPFFMSGRRPDHISIRPNKSVKPSKQTSGSYVCDFTGCDRSFGTSQGLAMHRTRSHGTHGLQDVSVSAGDPDREVEGESAIDRKRRRDRERYAQKKAQEARV